MAHPFAPSQTHNKLDLASFNHPTAQSFLLVQRLTDVHPPNVAPSGGQKDHITVSEASPGHVINPLNLIKITVVREGVKVIIFYFINYSP